MGSAKLCSFLEQEFDNVDKKRLPDSDFLSYDDVSAHLNPKTPVMVLLFCFVQKD